MIYKEEIRKRRLTDIKSDVIVGCSGCSIQTLEEAIKRGVLPKRQIVFNYSSPSIEQSIWDAAIYAHLEAEEHSFIESLGLSVYSNDIKNKALIEIIATYLSDYFLTDSVREPILGDKIDEFILSQVKDAKKHKGFLLGYDSSVFTDLRLEIKSNDGSKIISNIPLELVLAIEPLDKMAEEVLDKYGV